MKKQSLLHTQQAPLQPQPAAAALPPPTTTMLALPKMEAKLQRPSGSEAEREKTTTQLQELEDFLSLSYAERGTDTVTCTWQYGKGMALVDKPQHKHIMTMGTLGKPKELFPEEVLFLCGLGCARVVTVANFAAVAVDDDDDDDDNTTCGKTGADVECRDSATMNKRVWELCLRAGMSAKHYIAYSHLKRLGYVTRRFGITGVSTKPLLQEGTDMIVYVVWRPEKKAQFRKAPPDFYLAVCGMDEPFPGADRLAALAKWCRPGELKVAVVSTGDVAFVTVGEGI